VVSTAASKPGARLASAFKKLRRDGRKAFIVYLTAGDPDLDATVELVCRLHAEAGVDVVELGIPFTDPMADGVANQRAAERALKSGTSVRGVLDAIRRIRARCGIPIIFFTYLNPVLAYGAAAFARDATEAGADGLLLLDLPPDEDPPLLTELAAHGLAPVCLVAPNADAVRRRLAAKASKGFVYYVCRYGVTGERADLPDDLVQQLGELRAVSRVPVCVGFGISSPEQAAQAARAGDGVIVGSHLVRMLEEHAGKPDLLDRVVARARELATAVHAVRED
jgi:tryptophan synthase alpha chain